MADAPSYHSHGLVNLMAELEMRLIGSAPSPSLDPLIADEIPEGQTYVLVLFDGLGVAQLAHEAAEPLRRSHRATLQTPFPSTTSVALATVATGLPPSQHGLVAHLTWLEEANRVVNTLKWVDLAGETVHHDYASVLPRPNLWERLRSGGVEAITVQPSAFEGSPLSRLLYRGTRFEPTWDDHDLVEATATLSAEPGRLIFTYFWPVDFAGHVYGLHSSEFSDALGLASKIWEGILATVPSDVTVIGTADHGLIGYAEEDKVLIRQKAFRGLRFAGDPRGVQVWGDEPVLTALAAATASEITDPISLLGPEPALDAVNRTGDGLLLAPKGKVLLPPGFDKRLRSYHGGLEPAEIEIPLLIG
jgi:Type I phosphodiesterase / nucleotide pyrophosphatase